MPLAVGIFFLAAPVRNPEVQDCGAPMVFAVTGRTNSRLPPDGVVLAPDRLATLRAQTPCNERVDQRVRWATWSIGAFVVIALTGAVLGLADDRRKLRRSPRFESLLRERPAGSPGDVWDRPVVPPSDIGVALPDVEASDVEAFVVWSVVTVCVLVIVAGVTDTFDALGALNVAGLLGALILAAGARLVAAGQLALVDRGERSPADRMRRAVSVMVAADWSGRIRPAFGAIGVQSHALVRAGVERGRALVDLGVACAVAGLAHLALLGVLFLGVLVVGAGGGSWPRYSLALVLIVLAMAVAGTATGAARFRRLPCTLGRSTVAAVRERVENAPADLVLLLALASALPIVHGLVLWVLVASVGPSAPVVPVLFWTVVALAFRAWAPAPEGFVATDVVLAIGLCLAGAATAAAVAAVLVWRALMVWLPLGSGYLATRSLVRSGAL